MGVHIETIRTLGKFKKASNAICVLSLCEACGQDNQVCLFLIGFPQEFVIRLDDQFPGSLINLGWNSFSVENAFSLYFIIELFISFSKSSYIDIANSDPGVRHSILDERGL